MYSRNTLQTRIGAPRHSITGTHYFLKENKTDLSGVQAAKSRWKVAFDYKHDRNFCPKTLDEFVRGTPIFSYSKFKMSPGHPNLG